MGRCLFSIFGHGFDIQCIAGSYYDSVVYCHYRKILAGYSFMVYLLAIVQTFGAYLSMIFSLIGMVYQYGHASEVVDSISVESEIDKFEQL